MHINEFQNIALPKLQCKVNWNKHSKWFYMENGDTVSSQPKHSFDFLTRFLIDDNGSFMYAFRNISIDFLSRFLIRIFGKNRTNKECCINTANSIFVIPKTVHEFIAVVNYTLILR